MLGLGLGFAIRVSISIRIRFRVRAMVKDRKLVNLAKMHDRVQG